VDSVPNDMHSDAMKWTEGFVSLQMRVVATEQYEGWNFNSGNYLFTTDTK